MSEKKAVFAGDKALLSLMRGLSKGRQVWGLQKDGDELHLRRSEDLKDLVLGFYRAVEPTKSVFFPAREDLGSWPAPQKESKMPGRLLVGLKACDLGAFDFLDHVFLEGDFVDPHYKAARESAFIISSDCTAAKEVCFCTYLGRKPYPEEGFDLNISPVSGGGLVEAGSEAGEQALKEFGAGLSEADKGRLSERDERREQLVKLLARQSKKAGLSTWEDASRDFDKKFENPVWHEQSEKCVECGACNFICPTCHCFLLCELEEKEGFKRFKNWDACLYPAFARVAGGANPRKRRLTRLRNRFDKKFSFFVKELGVPACTGCGRCTEACAGKIDIKEILRKVS